MSVLILNKNKPFKYRFWRMLWVYFGKASRFAGRRMIAINKELYGE